MKSRKWVLRMLYFLLGFQTSMYDFTLKRDFVDFGVPISNIVIRMFFIMIWWQLKFIPALFCDLYGIGGYHRRPYIIISNFFAAIATLILATPNISASGYVFFLSAFNFFICIADVNYDACIIEDGREEDNDKRGKLQSKMWAWRYFGCMLGDTCGPLMWKDIKSEGVYAILSATCTCSLIGGIVLKDRQRRGRILNTKESTSNTTLDYSYTEDVVMEQVTEEGNPVFKTLTQSPNLAYLWSLVMLTLTNPVLKKLLMFNVLASLLPNAGFALFYYLTDAMGFTPRQMALLGFISGFGRLVGINIYTCFNQSNIRQIYVVVGILSVFVTIFPILLAIQVPIIPVLIPMQVPVNNQTDLGNVTIWKQIMVNDSDVYTNTGEYLLKNQTVPISDMLGLDRFWCALSDDTIGQILDEIRNMPLLSIATITCKALVEASAYSTLLSLLNATSGLRRLIDSLVMQALGIDHNRFENLWLLILICSLAEIFSVVLAYWYVPSTTLKKVAIELEEHEEIKAQTMELNVIGKEGKRNLDDELKKEIDDAANGIRFI